MARELDAKVARVLSDTSIAINVGEDAGVGTGDTVIVWRSVDVEDPDTGDVLGTVRLQNLRLQVYDVRPLFCLARVEVNSVASFAGLFKPSKVIASSNRVLDEEQVRLAVGDAVTVMIDDSLLVASADEDGDISPEGESR
jgi:hypothetical protein